MTGAQHRSIRKAKLLGGRLRHHGASVDIVCRVRAQIPPYDRLLRSHQDRQTISCMPVTESEAARQLLSGNAVGEVFIKYCRAGPLQGEFRVQVGWFCPVKFGLTHKHNSTCLEAQSFSRKRQMHDLWNKLRDFWVHYVVARDVEHIRVSSACITLTLFDATHPTGTGTREERRQNIDYPRPHRL